MLQADQDTDVLGLVDVERNSARKVLHNARGACGQGVISACHVSNLIGGSPSGKASDFDSDIRWFDPITPCQIFQGEAL